MESLQLHDGLLFQFDVVVHAGGRVEVVYVYAGSDTADAVDAANALHEASGIPRRIVIHDDVGAVEVDAFGKDFRGKEDVVIVGVLGVVGVEIRLHKGHAFLAVRGIHDEDLGVTGVGQAAFQIVGGVLSFGKND